MGGTLSEPLPQEPGCGITKLFVGEKLRVEGFGGQSLCMLVRVRASCLWLELGCQGPDASSYP